MTVNEYEQLCQKATIALIRSSKKVLLDKVERLDESQPLETVEHQIDQILFELNYLKEVLNIKQTVAHKTWCSDCGTK